MKEQLFKELMKWIGAIDHMASETGKFVVSQAPDVARQLLIHDAIENGVLMLIGMVFWTIAFFLYRAAKNFSIPDIKGDTYSDSFRLENAWGKKIGLYSLAGVSTAVGGAFFFVNLVPMLQIIFSPKYYILLQLKEMVK